jgi:hypothetical protein
MKRLFFIALALCGSVSVTAQNADPRAVARGGR